MTAYERVMAALNFTEPDRVPLVPSTRFASVKYAGYTLAQVYQDNGKYVEAQERVVNDFRLDAAWDLAGVYYVSRCLGQKMLLPEDDPPSALEPFINSPRDLERLAELERGLNEATIVQYQLDLDRKLRDRLGRDIPLIAYVESPFYLACVLRGTKEFYLDMYKQPTFARDLLAAATAICKRYSSLLANEAIDILYTACPQASRTMISKKLYLEYVHANFNEVFGFFRNVLKKKILFHVCGDWTDRFDLLVEEGPDILHVDKVDLRWLKEVCGQKVTLNGNVDTTKLLVGTPQEIEQEAWECIEAAAPGGGFLLGGACALGRDTPAANMQALATAVAEHGVYPINS